MQNNQPVILLYFSKRCPNSIKLLNQMAQAGFTFNPQKYMFVRNNGQINAITACCIDNPQIKRPNWLKVVPTLYTKMVGHPMVDTELQNWMNSFVLSSGQPQQQQKPKSNYYDNSEITGDSNISPYLGLEMGGKFSDMYSIIQDKDDKLTENNNAMQGTFSGLNETGDDLQHHKSTFWRNSIPLARHNGDITMPESSNKNNKSMDKAYENFMNQRKIDVPMDNGRR